MFAEPNESGWNVVLKVMKYVTIITYRKAFMLGEAPMKHMKLSLTKGGSLLRSEVGWIRARLGVQRLEVLRQCLDLRQVFELEWVIVGGKSDDFIFQAHL